MELFQSEGLSVVSYTADLSPQVGTLYSRFAPLSVSRFGFELPAVPTEPLLALLQRGVVDAIALKDNTGHVHGLLVYRIEPHGSVEVNMTALPAWVTPDAPDTLSTEAAHQHKLLLRGLVTRLTRPDLVNRWRCISYPLLGIQHQALDALLPLSFEGLQAGATPQAIGELKLADWRQEAITFRQDLPDGITLRRLQRTPQEIHAVAECVWREFHPLEDSCWDVRFRTPEGCNYLVHWLLNSPESYYPEACSVAEDADGQMIGVALMIAMSPQLANIPLVSVRQDYQGKGLGKRLVARNLSLLQSLRKMKRTQTQRVSVTHHAERPETVGLYRSLGFSIVQRYPHLHWNKTDPLS